MPAIDWKATLEEVRELRSSCQRCGAKRKRDSSGTLCNNNIEMAHRCFRKKYTLGQIIRRAYDKPCKKKSAFLTAVRSCWALCKACHLKYDKENRVHQPRGYMKATLENGFDVEWPLW